ncbi:MAG: hypothetical protein KGI27_10150 [Thaumarchaeota archaeon]|nr:hypothetical protein [Nitrososphaerota archaeon]
MTVPFEFTLPQFYLLEFALEKLEEQMDSEDWDTFGQVFSEVKAKLGKKV